MATASSVLSGRVSLLAGKSHEYDLLGTATAVVASIVQETRSHTTLLANYGISVEDIQNTPETLATRAYGGYLIDAATQGNALRIK